MIFKNALRRRPRLWICLGIIVFSMAAFLGISYSVVRYQGIRDLELALAETDKLDPYWRLEDLEAHRRPMPPPGANGFVQVLAAAEAMPAGNWPWPRFPEFDDDLVYHALVLQAMRKSLDQHDRMAPVLLNKEEVRALRTELERANVAFGMARRMVDFPFGRNPSMVTIRGSGTSVGSVSSFGSVYIRVLEVAKMLGPDARVHIYDDDIAGALHDVSAMLHIGRALEDEPDLIAQMVHEAIDQIALDMLERTLAGGVAAEKELASPQQELEGELATPKVLVGLRGIRALTDRQLEDAQTGVISSSDLQAQATSGRIGDSFPTRLFETLRFTLMGGNLQAVRARQLRNNNEVIAIGELPVQERLSAIRNNLARIQEQSTEGLAWMESLGNPPTAWYAKYLEEELLVNSMLSCAITAVAAERFRFANKRRFPRPLIR
jgi:hypothetical protein